jgi:hypothetical protein
MAATESADSCLRELYEIDERAGDDAGSRLDCAETESGGLGAKRLERSRSATLPRLTSKVALASTFAYVGSAGDGNISVYPQVVRGYFRRGRGPPRPRIQRDFRIAVDV